MRNKYGFSLIVLLAVCAFLLTFTSFSAASMADYENLPPFAHTGVESNVLLVMDYSGSMQSQAYYGTEWHRYPNTKVANYGDWGEVSEPYDHSHSYYGYYDSSKYYYYDGTKWIAHENSSKTGVGYKSELSGNFLNWLVMTRIDLSLKTFIGGKAKQCDSDTCTLKPQGAKRSIHISNLNCGAYVRPEDYGDSGEDYENDMLITVWGDNCQIGEFQDREANVEIEKENRQGIVQNNFDAVRFGFITYAGNNEGTIKHPVHDSNMTELISSMESEVPYGGTPTGQAMWEAHNYLRQVKEYDGHDYEYNDTYIDKNATPVIDPYYEMVNDEKQPAWCRKSFVVLVSDGEWNQGVDPVKPAHKMHTEDLRDLDENQTAKVYSLFTFSDDNSGENSMKTVSMFGNFLDDEDCPQEDWPYPYDDYPGNSKNVSYPLNECDPGATYNDCCSEWDSKDDNGVPDAYYSAKDGSELETALSEIFSAIRQETSSGTSVAALTEEETSGDLVNQAVFFPEKVFGDNKLNWVGYLYAYWFYNEPTVQNMREDTNQNKILEIEDDYILNFLSSQGDLKIDYYSSTESGERDEKNGTYNSLDDLHPVWEAGKKLRDRSPSNRTIYALSNSTEQLEKFNKNNVEDFKPFLGSDSSKYPQGLVNSGEPEYSELIKYVRGNDISQTRSRCTGEGTWKLGDIIRSTPITVDYPEHDQGYSLVFTGANDGMLHAFRVGKLMRDGVNTFLQNSGEDEDTDQVGKEEWAFVPKNSMPYLRFLANPNYSHINTVDLKPYLIETDDKKILIGGMRFGGGTGETEHLDSVNPPNDTCPDPTNEDKNGCVGRSSYFALNVTDPDDPKYMWSYSPPNLGFSYSGPAHITREGSNGKKHFVMFGSGPTTHEGTVPTNKKNLSFHILNLMTGEEKRVEETNIGGAFGGRLFTEGLDVTGDDLTDYVLSGYSQVTGGSTVDGGVFSIYTGKSDPNHWQFTKNYVNANNPVVGGITPMRCFGQWYIYFGTGQFFTNEDKGSNFINHLYGAPFTGDADGDYDSGTINAYHNTNEMECDDIYMKEDKNKADAWQVELNDAEADFLRERSYNTPSSTSFNAIMFNSAMPTSKICEFGGKSRFWGRNCATGFAMSSTECPGYTVDVPTFKYLVQLSGGDVQGITEDDFSGDDDGNDGGDDDNGDGEDGVTDFTPGTPGGPGKVMEGPSTNGEMLLWIEK